MTYLTGSRDALAKALHMRDQQRHGRLSYRNDWDALPEPDRQRYLREVDALIASGAVIPVDTLADAMEQRLLNVREFGERGSAYYNGAAHMLRAFAALTERSQS